MKVILLMAVTADGMIARSSKEMINWTGKADKEYFVQITKKTGIMIMGSNTFDTIGKVLPGRKNIVMTRDKNRISNDPDLVYTDKSPGMILKDIEDQGFASVAIIGGAVINTLFMTKQLINEIHVTVVPRMFGKGLNLFEQSLDAKLSLLGVETIEENCVLLKYKVIHGA